MEIKEISMETKKITIHRPTKEQTLKACKRIGYKYAIEYFWIGDDEPITYTGAHTLKEARKQIKQQKEIFEWIGKTNIIKL